MSTSVNGNEPPISQDQTKGLAEGGTMPAATAPARVLIQPSGAVPIVRPPPPPAVYTLVGSTANFEVAFDSPLRGVALAEAILGRCEHNLSQLRGFFGGVSAASRFSVFIDPGKPGIPAPSAYHAICADTEIHCVVDSATDGDRANFLNCAEVDEVLMAAQLRGLELRSERRRVPFSGAGD
jgi:hypothetical protein